MKKVKKMAFGGTTGKFNREKALSGYEKYLNSMPSYQEARKLSSSLGGKQPSQEQIAQLNRLSAQMQKDPKRRELEAPLQKYEMDRQMRPQNLAGRRLFGGIRKADQMNKARTAAETQMKLTTSGTLGSTGLGNAIRNTTGLAGNIGKLGGSILGGTQTRPANPQPTRITRPTGISGMARNPSAVSQLGGLGGIAAGSMMGKKPGMKKGGSVKKMASGGSVSSASKRADGCAIKGKTKGKMV
jgi:hypothetical protein